MSVRVLLTFSLLSAITLALVYGPILSKLSIALASPYPKADMTKRFFAAMVDGTLVGMAFIFYRNSQFPAYLVAAAAYLLLRDAARGRSVGKFLCGLVVIDLATGGPSGLGPCVSRNVLFLLPGANAVAAFLEAATIVQDPQGQRLGDRFALRKWLRVSVPRMSLRQFRNCGLTSSGGWTGISASPVERRDCKGRLEPQKDTGTKEQKS